MIDNLKAIQAKFSSRQTVLLNSNIIECSFHFFKSILQLIFQGAQYLLRDNLKAVWLKFSTLIQIILSIRVSVFVERQVSYSGLFTFLVGWYASPVSLPPGDVPFALLTCHPNDMRSFVAYIAISLQTLIFTIARHKCSFLQN